MTFKGWDGGPKHIRLVGYQETGYSLSRGGGVDSRTLREEPSHHLDKNQGNWWGCWGASQRRAVCNESRGPVTLVTGRLRQEDCGAI